MKQNLGMTRIRGIDMKANILCIAGIILGLAMIAYGSYLKGLPANELTQLNIEKTLLEIEKLKYELSIYKETEENFK